MIFGKIIAFLIALLLPGTLNGQVVKEIQQVDQQFITDGPITGQIDTIQWHSKFLNELRSITIYTPQNYNSAQIYGILITTDGVCAGLADDVEPLIINGLIQPIIIVALNLREKQSGDEVFIDYQIDFRALDYLKEEVPIPDHQRAMNDPKTCDLVTDRYIKYSDYVELEVIPYIKSKYYVSSSKAMWSLGGFSNGGAYVYGFTTDRPQHFGNAIVMSPAWVNDYQIQNADARFFLCAGKDENGSFYGNTFEYLGFFQINKIPYTHKIYDAGHDWQMWFSFYLDSIKKIYQP